MISPAERKDHPISMRLPEADVAMIDRAAGLRGRSRTDFVREAAVRAAEEVVLEQALLRMSSEDFSQFMDVLARPVAPVPEMVRDLKRPAPCASTTRLSSGPRITASRGTSRLSAPARALITTWANILGLRAPSSLAKRNRTLSVRVRSSRDG